MKPGFYFIAACVFLTLACLPCQAGVIRTLDGKTYPGTITFGKGYLAVSPRPGSDIHVDPANLLDADLVDKPDDAVLHCGLVLIDGASIAADQIIACDDTNVTYRLAGAQSTIPLAKVARIIFRPVPAPLWDKLRPGQYGALLDNGDLFEGDLKSIHDGGAIVESVIFGISIFNTDNQVLAVCVADPRPVAANWVIHLSNGATLASQNLQFTPGKLTLTVSDGSTPTIPLASIAQIRCGANRLQPLGDLKPQKIEPSDPASYTIDATPAGVPIALQGRSPTHGVCLAAGASVTYTLDGKYRAFIGSAGIPKDIAPFVHVHFIILADGKQILATPDRTSVDPPFTIAANIAGVKNLILRLESDQNADLGALGVWADPALVKAQP